MKIFYHNDLDGHASAAIVYHYGKVDMATRYGCELIEVTYKDVIKVSEIQPNERVIIVDFSFAPEVMKQVFERTENVVWIDHHKTAEEYETLYGRKVTGLRDFSGERSATWLCWKYFTNTHEVVPYAVTLIDLWDTWRWEKEGTASRSATEWFKEGMAVINPHIASPFWKDLFTGNSSAFVDNIIEQGSTAATFRANFCRDYVEQFGHETFFEGYKAHVLNLYRWGSQAHDSIINDYDLCISFAYDGNSYTVGLYSKKIDVSEIAKKYGGGGHKGASGFVCKELPFNAL